MDEKKGEKKGWQNKKHRTIIIVIASVVLAIAIILSITLPLTIGKQNKIAYTITYNNLDGIPNVSGNPSEYRVNTATIVLQNLTHTDVDKKFLGWYDQMTGGTKITEIAIGSSGNIVLYARWQVPTVGLKYALINGDKEYAVSSGTVTDGDVVIASKYDGKPVTEVEAAGFAMCAEITSVYIPDSVTTISEMAFTYCSKLASVSIPDGVKSIGRGAFGKCPLLTSITLPKNLTAVSEQLFYECESLTNIVIPEGVTSIGAGAFGGCKSLKGIHIPKLVKSIEVDSLTFCSSLTSITVDSDNTNYKSVNNCLLQKDSTTNIFNTMLRGCPDSVIPDTVTVILGAFNGCTNVTTVNISSIVTNISDDALLACPGVTNLTVASDNPKYKSDGNCLLSKDGKILYNGFNTSTIPNGVTTIQHRAFLDCAGLKSITIPESVTNIDHQAFSGCTSLTSIHIPKNATTIDVSFISECTGIEQITVDPNNTSFKSEGNCLLSKDGTELIKGCKTSVIPNGVTTIQYNAFAYCKGLKQINLPNSVTKIQHSAFAYCKELKQINLPSSVTSVDVMAFTECTEIEQITVDPNNTSFKSEGNCLLSKDGTKLIIGCKTSVIPSTVTTIGIVAFAHCEGLTTITLPSSVTKIEDRAFSDCLNLTNIFIPSTVEIIEGGAFSGCRKLTVKCQVDKAPVGWAEYWDDSIKETLWGQTN